MPLEKARPYHEVQIENLSNTYANKDKNEECLLVAFTDNGETRAAATGNIHSHVHLELSRDESYKYTVLKLMIKLPITIEKELSISLTKEEVKICINALKELPLWPIGGGDLTRAVFNKLCAFLDKQREKKEHVE